MIYFISNILSQHSIFEINVFDGNIFLLDYIIVSSGKSVKHIKSVSLYLSKSLKETYNDKMILSGLNSEWVIIYNKYILIHLILFKPRLFYDLDFLYSENCKKINIF